VAARKTPAFGGDTTLPQKYRWLEPTALRSAGCDLRSRAK